MPCGGGSERGPCGPFGVAESEREPGLEASAGHGSGLHDDRKAGTPPQRGERPEAGSFTSVGHGNGLHDVENLFAIVAISFAAAIILGFVQLLWLGQPLGATAAAAASSLALLILDIREQKKSGL